MNLRRRAALVAFAVLGAAANPAVVPVATAASTGPTITGIEPSAGPVTGETRVVLRGSGFSGSNLSVKFGGAEALNAELKDDNTIVATAPPHPLGTVHVAVTRTRITAPAMEVTESSTPSDTDQFTYLPWLSPSSGPTYGATEVVISGSGFKTGVSGVNFGDAPALFHQVDSDTAITAVSPPQPRGTEVDVTITGPTVGTITSGNRFTYYEGTWSPAVAMGTPYRESSTATVLLSGKVLVAGGFTAHQAPVASAELYDPTTESWSGCSTNRASGGCPGPMTEPRKAHTATVLGDGRVLVVGGTGRTGSLASAELYDPATGTWTITGSLARARLNHAATLLPSGQVLVAGGSDSAGGLQSAELYNPLDETWSSCSSATATPSCPAPMTHARSLPSATLLDQAPCGANCGKVLVAGGSADRDASAELYDPSTGTWTATPPMTAARSDHSAAALPTGMVLVAGGNDLSVIDALQGGLHSAELYDPVSNRWFITGSMTTPRSRHTATLLGNVGCGDNCEKVLVAGGDGPPNRSGVRHRLASSELYNPLRGTWEATGPLRLARRGHFAALLMGPDCTSSSPPSHCGKVLVDGDAEAGELYDPRADPPQLKVTGVGPLAGTRLGGTSVTVTGTGLVRIRSVHFAGVPASTTYQSDTRLTVATPSHPTGPADIAVSATGLANPLVIGRFTYTNGGWVPTGSVDSCKGGAAPCPARYHHTATLLDGPVCRSGAPPTYCGKVVVAGGTDQFGDAYEDSTRTGRRASVALYDPASGTWTATGPLRHARSNHTATLLDGPACHTTSPPSYCGRVLVVGGLDQSGFFATASAELYDPVRGTWSPTGSLSEPSVFHSATLLAGPNCAPNCDKVLLAGGARVTVAGWRTSAELYDPEAVIDGVKGAWTRTGSLITPRAVHSATLLPTGDVLVAGGLGPDTSGRSFFESVNLVSAELYNPASGSWQSTGSLRVPRFSHSATLLDRGACGRYCGKVLAVGGVAAFTNTDHDQGNVSFVHSTEVYDRSAVDPKTKVQGVWLPADSLGEARGGHTATALPNGKLLVAGGGMSFEVHGYTYRSLSSAELFDPALNAGAGGWRPTSALNQPRGLHTATLLDGAPCRLASAPTYCGKVLAAGGAGPGDSPRSGFEPPPLASAELYVEPPTVTAVSPSRGPAAGPTTVSITGTNLVEITGVSFGDLPALRFKSESPTRIAAVAPPHTKGRVEVVLTNSAGALSTSATPNAAARFTYVGVPDPVRDLDAVALSSNEVALSFSSPDDGTRMAPATRYVVKQSRAPITSDAEFGAAEALCGGICSFNPGQSVRLSVGGLAPVTTYHYALRALNERGEAGPISNTAAATTPGERSSSSCPPTCAPPRVPPQTAARAVTGPITVSRAPLAPPAPTSAPPAPTSAPPAPTSAPPAVPAVSASPPLEGVVDTLGPPAAPRDSDGGFPLLWGVALVGVMFGLGLGGRTLLSRRSP